MNDLILGLILSAPPSKWNDWIAVVAGLALYAWLVGWVHLRWFGVPPLA